MSDKSTKAGAGLHAEDLNELAYTRTPGGAPTMDDCVATVENRELKKRIVDLEQEREEKEKELEALKKEIKELNEMGLETMKNSQRVYEFWKRILNETDPDLLEAATATKTNELSNHLMNLGEN